MKLTIKHFKSDQRVDVCDEFDNVVYRVHHPDEKMGIGVEIMVKAYVRGFSEGWNRARHAIGDCHASDRMVDVDALNARQWR